MNLIQVLKISFSVLKVNKIRSLLTSLGVIIGIASVIVIVSVGAGAQSLIVNQVNSVGANLLAILPGASDKNGPPAIAFGIVIKTLKYEDAVAIGKEVPNIIGVSAYVAGSANMTYQSKNGRYSYYGVMSSYT
ncbi:MAG: ABC transporter permease, partial [bacterium]